MQSFWDQRYSEEGFAYGNQPNVFMAQQLAQLKPGDALFPAEGEGRNAVYAAAMGWKAMAYDSSVEGKKKALQLAKQKEVPLTYISASHEQFPFEEASADLVVLIFVHVPLAQRSLLHQNCWKALRPGGHLLLEGFAKEQLGLSSGGPQDASMLFSLDELKNDFPAAEFLVAESGTTTLHEGPYHEGRAETVRLLAKKN